MRINEDYLDRVTVADIDDEDIDDVVESQEPSPGKWKFAMLIIPQYECEEEAFNRCHKIMELFVDEYNIFETDNNLDKYLSSCEFEYRRTTSDFSNMKTTFIVEFNCKNKPYIPIYALAMMQSGSEAYFLTSETRKYTISQVVDYNNLQLAARRNEEPNELLVRAIVDMAEYGIGQNYDYAELHEWVIKRQ